MSKEPKERKIKIYTESSENFCCWICGSNFKKYKGCLFHYNQDGISRYFASRSILSLRYIINSEFKKGYIKPKIRSPTDNFVASLMDCFSAFEKPETLTADNSWRCPRCKDLFAAKKQLMIYKSPKILILCLKIFKKISYTTQKNHKYFIL